MPLLQSLFKNGKTTPISQPATPLLECLSPVPTPKLQPPSSYKHPQTNSLRSSQETIRSSAPRTVPSPSTTIRLESSTSTSPPTRPPRPPAPLFTALPPPVPPPNMPIPTAPVHHRQGSASSVTIKLNTVRSHPSLKRAGQSPTPKSLVQLQDTPGLPLQRPLFSRSRSATLDGEILVSRPILTTCLTSSPPPVKRRPAALRLQTSNLTPPHSPSPPRNAAEPLVKPTIPFQTPTLDPTSGTRTAADTVEQLGSDDSDHTIIPIRMSSLGRTGSAQPLSRANMARIKRLDRRRSSSTGDAVLEILETEKNDLVEAIRGASTSTTSTRYTPSTLTPASIAPSSTTASAAPSISTPSTLRPFHNVPLPWTAVSTQTISAALGEHAFQSLLASAVQQTNSHPPTMLLPSTLSITVSETLRLNGELARLRDKYDTLIRHRDGTLGQIEGSLVKSNADVLLRVARQIFICNDQIRQIQIQGEQHTVGALKATMARSTSSQSYPIPPAPSSTQVKDHVEKFISKPESAELKIIITAEPTPRGCTGPGPRPISTATIISVNHLGFPLPPNRPHAPDRPSLAGRSISGLFLEIRVEGPGDDEGVNEILIYPPGHRRSLSAPLLLSGLPQTPWQNSHDSVQVARPVHVEGDEGDPSRPGTAPLRVRAARSQGGEKGIAKARSLAVKRTVSSASKKRAKRGRESQLQTPQSILLSLATAP